MTSTAIELHAITHTYPARRRQVAHTALCGLSLTIPSGETVALLGPNGGGKSTLLRVVAGLLRPTSGRCLVDGRSPSAARESLGAVFQSPALDRHLSVRANLQDHIALFGIYGAEARVRVDADLDRAGIAELADHLVGTLSGGQQRRVDLVRALLSRPHLLLLDEPTTGLDPTARRAFLDRVMEEQSEREMTVLMTTHLVDEADRLDRVILLDRGAIVADGAPAALRAALGALRVTIHDSDFSPPDDSWQRTDGGYSSAVSHNNDARLAEFIDAGRPFSVGPPTLADVFAHHTGHALTESSP